MSGMSDAAAAASTRSTRPMTAPIGCASATGRTDSSGSRIPYLE